MYVELYMYNRMKVESCCYIYIGLCTVFSPTPCTAAAIRGSHALTDLELQNCGIESTAMSHLCEGLSALCTLNVLNLGGNKLGTEGTRHLGKGRLCGLGVRLHSCMFEISWISLT